MNATRSAMANEVRLDLEGMTCASCAARIEKGLNKLNGVEASVNFVTEQATVHCDPSVTTDQLVGAVDRWATTPALLRPRISCTTVTRTANTITMTSPGTCCAAGWSWRSC